MATMKQKKAFKEVTEKNRSISGAMRDVGYTPSTATRPKTLTDSKGWLALLDEYLPDEWLNECLNEDIRKKPQNRKSEMELAYKLKGKLTDKIDITTQGEQIKGFEFVKVDIAKDAIEGKHEPLDD